MPLILIIGRVRDELMGRWFDIPGWFEFTQGEVLQRIAHGRICVEIGSFKGRSTACMAEVAKHVHAIDTFAARANGQTQEPHLTTFDDFNENTKCYPNITCHKGVSVNVATTFEDSSVTLVFIDGYHGAGEVKADIEAWWPKLKIGGIMAFHDYAPGFPGVMDTVDSFFPKLDCALYQIAWVTKRKEALKPDADSNGRNQ